MKQPPTVSTCYMANVIAHVADGIATARWVYFVADGMAIRVYLLQFEF